MRHCKRCGRVIPDEHDIGEPRYVFTRRGRGRMDLQRVRTYGCRVRLTAVSPLGRVEVPATPQRTKFNDTAYRHESRFT